MSIRDYLVQAFESLSSHPRRVVASAAGVLWGAAAIVLVLAWGSGFREYMHSELSSYGRACVFVMPGVSSSGFPGYRPGVAVRFARADVAAAERSAADAVEAIIPEHLSDERVLAEARGRVRRLDLTGTDERFAVHRNFTMAYGRSLTALDVGLRRPVAILGNDAASALYGSAREALGQTLRVEGHSLEVIGVASAKGRQYFNTNRPDNRLLIVPITTAEGLFGFDERDVGRINIYPVRGVEPEAALRAGLREIAPRSGFHPDDVDAVRWFDISQPSRISELFYAGFMVFTGLCGTVTLLIGAVGLANYQLATISERCIELAVARAIGARSRVLVVQTAFEAILVAGVAVGLGIACGLVGCWALATLPPAGLFPAPIVSTPAVLVTALASLAVAFVATLIPALRVRRIDVSSALRGTV